MRQLVRRFDFLQQAYWQARKGCGLPAKSEQEVWHHLKRASESTPRPTTFQFPWGEFKCIDLGQVRAQFDEIFIRKEYAFKTDTAQPVIVDCGGNVGMSAVWFKQNYPDSKLTIYEPDPKLADCIEANLAAAKLGGFTLQRKAVWVKSGQIGFDLAGNDSGKIKADASRQVEAVDLAEQLPAVTDLLKMDIEGAEYPVINHLCQTGAIQRVKNLVCEFHILRGHDRDFLETTKKLMDSGMQVAMNGAIAGPWLGKASEESPFAVIGRNHVLVEVYAWRNGVNGHGVK